MWEEMAKASPQTRRGGPSVAALYWTKVRSLPCQRLEITGDYCPFFTNPVLHTLYREKRRGASNLGRGGLDYVAHVSNGSGEGTAPAVGGRAVDRSRRHPSAGE